MNREVLIDNSTSLSYTGSLSKEGEKMAGNRVIWEMREMKRKQEK